MSHRDLELILHEILYKDSESLNYCGEGWPMAAKLVKALELYREEFRKVAGSTFDIDWKASDILDAEDEYRGV